MFIVGVDIAKRSHEAIIIDRAGNIIKKAFNFKNDCTGFAKFLAALNGVSENPTDFLIGMESTSHYWLALYSNLQKLGYTVHVINPIQSNALRGMYIRQIKTDEHDSFIIAEVIRFGRYTEGGLPPSRLYELRELCRARSFIVDMNSDLKRKVIALLDQVFPEYEAFFTDMFGLSSSALLINYSTPEEILSADIEKIVELIAVPSRNRFRHAKATEIKNAASNSFGIAFGSDTLGMLIKHHLTHIQYIESQIEELDMKIAEIFAEFNTHLTTIPGIGPVLGATIFSEIGDISKFSSSAKLAAFAGIDPTIKQSGEFIATHNHMSKRGSPYLRRALWQAASCAVRSNPEMKVFFQRKRDEGKPYMNVIGHVTRKMTSIIYAVLRDGKPYYSNLST